MIKFISCCVMPFLNSRPSVPTLAMLTWSNLLDRRCCSKKNSKLSCRSHTQAVVTAGALRHPTSDLLLQKGTQILTSSKIMKHIIDALKCRHDHPHDHVAGSCQVKGLGRKLVSQYSELYTRVFVEKVIKCLQCNSSAGEKNSPAQEGHNTMVIRPAGLCPKTPVFPKGSDWMRSRLPALRIVKHWRLNSKLISVCKLPSKISRLLVR